MQDAPGPRNPFSIGGFPGIFGGKDRLWIHLEYAEKYGDTYRFAFGPVYINVTRDPDNIKHVLQENPGNYVKGRGLQKVKFFLGEGLLTSEGDLWRRQRKLAQPAFHRQKLQRLFQVMADLTQEMIIESWKASQVGTIDVAREMMRLTLNIAAKTLFSVDVRHEADTVGKALTVVLREASKRIFTIIDWPMAIPTPGNVRLKRACDTLDRVVFDIIQERRRTKVEHFDLLGMLMDVRDEDTGESMSDKQIRDEVMTLFLAGHETTANLLAWCCYLLSKNPIVTRKLTHEIDTVLAGRRPTFEDIASLKYTRMVIDETLRLYPPAWIIGRTALGEDAIGGYRVPAKSLIAMPPWVVHRHPRYWPNPEGFDPERFTPEASASRHKYAYIPFGGGPRICIGNTFALMEAQLIVAMILQRFRLELASWARVEPEPVVTLRPRNGVPMAIHARGVGEPAARNATLSAS
jgi:cytochrome P450